MDVRVQFGGDFLASAADALFTLEDRLRLAGDRLSVSAAGKIHAILAGAAATSVSADEVVAIVEQINRLVPVAPAFAGDLRRFREALAGRPFVDDVE